MLGWDPDKERTISLIVRTRTRKHAHTQTQRSGLWIFPASLPHTPLALSVSLCVCVCVCLSLCLSLSLPVSLSLWPSVAVFNCCKVEQSKYTQDTTLKIKGFAWFLKTLTFFPQTQRKKPLPLSSLVKPEPQQNEKKIGLFLDYT